MFTAKDVDKIVKENTQGSDIDYWIEHTLVKLFIESPRKAFVPSTVLRINKWTQQTFIEAMGDRGFSVNFVSDQRDGDFYVITYPPQSL